MTTITNRKQQAIFPCFNREKRGEYKTVKDGIKYYVIRLLSGSWVLYRIIDGMAEKMAIAESKTACYMMINKASN